MSKRRLTKKQLRNIRQQQERRLHKHGEEQHRGLVISHHGKQLLVEDLESGQQTRCAARATVGRVITGDRVRWHPASKGPGVITAIEPRDSLLERPDPYGRPKPVAANVDEIIVVIAVEPAPNDYLIDRYLIAIERAGIEPVLLLNKSDLLDPDSEQIPALLNRYQSIGYTVLQASCELRHGLDGLRQRMTGRTSILVGQSGVGKSSLVKALLPEQEIAIGELSETSGEGLHTTRTSTLYHLPDGGDLIDSPGIRDFGIWQLTVQDVAKGFPEFRARAHACRFNDCTHRHEPGCAVKAALEAGEIDPARYRNYLHMLEDIEAGVERATPDNLL